MKRFRRENLRIISSANKSVSVDLVTDMNKGTSIIKVTQTKIKRYNTKDLDKAIKKAESFINVDDRTFLKVID